MIWITILQNCPEFCVKNRQWESKSRSTKTIWKLLQYSRHKIVAYWTRKVAMKMVRNGYILDIFWKYNIPGISDGLLMRSERKRGVNDSCIITRCFFHLACLSGRIIFASLGHQAWTCDFLWLVKLVMKVVCSFLAESFKATMWDLFCPFPGERQCLGGGCAFSLDPGAKKT